MQGVKDGQERSGYAYEELLEGGGKTSFRSLAATRNHMSSTPRRRYARSPKRGNWKRLLKKALRHLKGVEKVTWVQGSWEERRKRISTCTWIRTEQKRPETKSTCGCMMMTNGTGPVKNTSVACINHGRRVLRGCHRSTRGPRNAVDDGGLGTELVGSNLDGFQRSRSDRLQRSQEVTKKGKARIKRVPGGQNLPDHLTKGKTWCEINELIRGVGRRMTVSDSDKGNEHKGKKWQHR